MSLLVRYSIVIPMTKKLAVSCHTFFFLLPINHDAAVPQRLMG
jgi:hypothetical protein